MSSIRVAELYNKPLPEHPHWVSGGVLPKNGVMIMGGEAKIGKTWLCLEMAQTLSEGGNLWGLDKYETVDPVGVHYFDAEVGEYEFHRRVKLKYDVLGRPPRDSFFFSSRLTNFAIDTSEGQMVLARELEESGARVAVIDPVGAALSGDENSNQDVERMFTSLSELMISMPELSFILIHHYGKPPKNREESDYDPLSHYNFRGASKFVDRATTLITVARMADHPGEWMRIKTRFKIRQGPPPEHDMKLSVLPGGLIIPTPEAARVEGGTLKKAKAVAWGYQRRNQ